MSSYYYSDSGSEIIQNYDISEPRQLRYFSFFTALSQVSGFLMLFFTGYWHANYNNGYQWGKNYNDTDANGIVTQSHVLTGNLHYHATFMTFGLVFLQGEAILMYRVFRQERKLFAKILHGLFHLFALILLIFGLIAIVTHKNNLRAPSNKHMFSAHSWVGVSVVVAYILQYVTGFVNFAFPKTSPVVREWYLPVHRAIGLIIFVVSCAQALFGVMQEIWILMRFSDEDYFFQCYPGLDCNGQGLVINFNVIFMILYAISVVYLASSKKYRREKTLDEI